MTSPSSTPQNIRAQVFFFPDLLSHAAYLSAFHLSSFCEYFLSPIVYDPFVLVCLYVFLDTYSRLAGVLKRNRDKWVCLINF